MSGSVRLRAPWLHRGPREQPVGHLLYICTQRKSSLLGVAQTHKLEAVQFGPPFSVPDVGLPEEATMIEEAQLDFNLTGAISSILV